MSDFDYQRQARSKLPLISAPIDCTSCGACCFTNAHEHIPVFDCDLERMNASARALTHVIGGRKYMRLFEGHCAALTLDSAQGLFLCSIYEMRPDCCRSFQRGSSQCLAELSKIRRNR